jgi:hypothetical protein
MAATYHLGTPFKIRKVGRVPRALLALSAMARKPVNIAASGMFRLDTATAAVWSAASGASNRAVRSVRNRSMTLLPS